MLERARGERVFSGAAWACGRSVSSGARGWLGTLAWEGPPVSESTLWDLASLTKPIVGLAVMSLVESGDLTLDDPVARFLPAFTGSPLGEISVYELLTHTSRIPGQQPLYRTCATRDELLAALVRLPLRPGPGVVEYSSQGFMILGLIASRAAGVPLDVLVRERVTAPLGMDETRFLLPEADHRRAAATEDCPWRGRIVQGTVHDENAEVLGGVAGHAGLFGTLGDLERLGHALCRASTAATAATAAPGASASGGAGGRVLGGAALALMTAPHTDGLGLRRGLAWQGRDPHGCSGGDLLSASAYGHTGFTGTSLWVDPELDVFVVLLTNRVHPTRSGDGIARLRRAFHNVAITEALG